MVTAAALALGLALGATTLFGAGTDAAVLGPVDLARTFTSPVDGSPQPYRLYLPSAYDGKRAVPLMVALHGTTGNEGTYFDDKTYGDGIYKREAEKRGVAMLCPNGRDSPTRPVEWPGVVGMPTEWRGTGELHVLAAIEDVCRRFRIDPDRIVCTGQSMGGTGTTYLCTRYPDIFAAGIPLSSTYGHVSLVANLRHVPMLYVQGEKDLPFYAKDGPIPLTKKMQELGYDGTLRMVPGGGHNTMDVTTEQVFDWAQKQRRVRHPRRVTFRAYLPVHGRAYWTEIQKVQRTGWFAEIDARIEDNNRIDVTLTHATRVALRPEPELLKLDQAIEVVVNGRRVFSGQCNADEEIRLDASGDQWKATTVPRRVISRAERNRDPLGTVVNPPNWDGAAESSLGSWLADAMRDAAGTDIVICSQSYYLRGVPLQAGQAIDAIDLINWLRPMDCSFALFKLRGADLLEIIESNILNEPKQHRFLIQVSGCRYRFDRGRPPGHRIVSTDIDPAREYSIVAESLSVTRTDAMRLAGRYGKIPFQHLELTTLSAAWRHIEKHGGKIDAKLDGRVEGN